VRTVLKQPFFAPSAVPLASDAGASGDDGQDERPPVNGIPSRRLLVFVNPFGGTGLGRKVWKQVRPMFLVANIDLHLVGTTAFLTEPYNHSLLINQLPLTRTSAETKYAGHAGEVAASLDIEKYDGIVTISGDGLLHEGKHANLWWTRFWRLKQPQWRSEALTPIYVRMC
jgi:hypothetical protein